MYIGGLMKYWIGILFVMVFMSSVKAEEMETVQSKQYFTFANWNFSADLQQNENKLLMIHVWAVWCSPCIEEIPDLLELAQNLQKELTVIIVESSEGDQEHILNRILMKYGKPPSSNVAFVEASNEILDEVLGLHYVPISYLFDRNQGFILKAKGVQSWSGTKSSFVPNWWPFGETWEDFLVECYFESENCSEEQKEGKQFNEAVSLRSAFFQSY